MNPTEPPFTSGVDAADLNAMYREICNDIRATDEISLKLLAAVPLATGVGIALLVRSGATVVSGGARVLLSVFAALVTFAIYRWERKNIATCSHFRRWAEVVEHDYFRLPHIAQLQSAPSALPHGPVTAPPKSFGRVWGKTDAVRLLYWTAILGWLAAGLYSLVG